MKMFFANMGLLAILLVFATSLGLFDRWLNPGVKLSKPDSDFNAIGSALRAYKINAGQFPTTEQGLNALVERPTIPPIPAKWTQLMRKPPLDPWQNEYQYRRLPDDDPRGFEIRSLWKDGVPSEDDVSSLDE